MHTETRPHPIAHVAFPRGAFAAIRRHFGRVLAEAARRRSHAEARAALEAMDDAMLSDIGLARGDIPFRVASGRDPHSDPRDPRR